MSTYTPVKLAFNVFEPHEKSDNCHIILIHGITSSKETWYEIANNLANESKCKVLALDMRNHGDSEWADLFSCDVMAQDVINFMNEHSINTAIFVGHSLGGKVVMILALTQPERVKALIIEDMSPRKSPEHIRNAALDYIKLMQNSLQLIPPGMDLSSASKLVGKAILRNSPKEFQSSEECDDKIIPGLGLVKKEGLYAWKMNAEVLKAYIMNRVDRAFEGCSSVPALFLYGTLSPLNMKLKSSKHLTG